MNYMTNPIAQAKTRGITIVEYNMLQNLASKKLEDVVAEIMEKSTTMEERS